MMPPAPKAAVVDTWDGSWQAVKAINEQLSLAEIPSAAKEGAAEALAQAMQAGMVPMHATQMAHLVMRQALGLAMDTFCATAESQLAIQRTPPKASVKAVAASKKVSTSQSQDFLLDSCQLMPML